MDGGQKGGSGEPVMPLVMPVYPPARSNLCHHVAPPPAYSAERHQLKEECRYRCSWRLATVCLTLLSLLLLALMAYFAGGWPGHRDCLLRGIGDRRVGIKDGYSDAANLFLAGSKRLSLWHGGFRKLYVLSRENTNRF